MAVWELGFAAGHVSEAIVSEVVACAVTWILGAGSLTWRPAELLLLLLPGELTGFLLRTVWLQREAKRPTTKGLCHRVYLPLNSRLSLVISRKLVKYVITYSNYQISVPAPPI